MLKLFLSINLFNSMTKLAHLKKVYLLQNSPGKYRADMSGQMPDTAKQKAFL